MRNVQIEQGTNFKIYNYGNYIVIVDFAKHIVDTKWLCGSCREFAAENHGTWAFCKHCASPIKRDRDKAYDDKKEN